MRRKKASIFGIKEASSRSGIHPGTIRLYEKIGAIPAIGRSPNNYRVFTETNVLQIRIAWQAFRFTWLSGPIRRTGLDVIAHSVTADFSSAMKSAEQLDALIDEEIREAKSAIRAVKRWVTRVPTAMLAITVRTSLMLRVKDAVQLTSVSADTLRSWERNGLIKPNRTDNRYRVYSSTDLERIRVIQTLKKARYSTMSILRMFNSIEKNSRTDIAHILDTPDDDDIIYVTDRWLTTLKDLKRKSCVLMDLIRTA